MNVKEIYEALEFGKKNGGVHGCFQEGKQRDTWNKVRTSSYYREILDEVRTETEVYLKEPIKAILYSEYRIFEETGSRKEYQKSYFDRRGRLAAFAVMSLAEEEKRYLTALEDIIWAICDEYTWCLPAHLGGQSEGQSINPAEISDRMTEEKGRILFAGRQHKKVIDLFAAETGFALAEMVHLLEGKLAPIVVGRARKEIKERILEPISEMGRIFQFETSESNWAAVCAGSIGIAAIYLIEDNTVLTPILHRLLGAMESFLNGFENDGVCKEGLGYWNYGFGFYVYFADLINQRTAGKIDLLNGEKIKNVALFQQNSYLDQDWVVSFSDGPRTARYNAGLTHYLKSKFEEIVFPSAEYRCGFKDDPCYRWGHIIRNLVWSHDSCTSSKLESSVCYLQDSQWFISKNINHSSIFCFAAKGGHNAEPHNHNDIGNFILYGNGEALIPDLGYGEYTKQYFGKERYSFFCNGSQGHSVPIVEDCYQEPGGEHRGEVLMVETSEQRDIIRIDITKAYKNNNLLSLVRIFDFYKTKESKLIIEDIYEFEEIPESFVERFITFNQPEYIEGGRIRIIGEKNLLDIVFDPKALEYSSEKVEFINHEHVVEEVFTIDLCMKKPAKKNNIQVVFEVALV